MGSDRNAGRAFVTWKRGYHIARAVEFGFPSEGAKLFGHMRRALLFKESRRGDAAELQVPLVDPGALLPEPVQACADAGRGGEFGNGWGEQRHGKLQFTAES